jgi:hypothetical protein
MANFFRTDAWVKAANGPAIAGAQVFVVGQPANVPSSLTPSNPSPLLQVYADVNGLLPLTQPVIADGFGHVSFYVATGPFTLAVYFNGILQNYYPDQFPMGQGSGGGSSISLETNGVPNVVQDLLNLVAGSGTSLSADSNGDVIISSTGSSPSILLKTNGTANVVQTLLNLVAGSNITLSSDSGGDVTISSSGSGLSPDYVQNISTSVALGFGGATNAMVKASAGGSGISPTLPNATTCTGQKVTVIQIDSGIGGVNITAILGQTIGCFSATTYMLTNQEQCVVLESDGFNWMIVGEAS